MSTNNNTTTPAPDKRTFKTFTFNDLKAMPQTKWLIRGIIPEATAGILSGETGSFKSFFSLDMALSIAIGIPWQGNDTKPGNVLYIAAEGFFTMLERARAWALYHDIELPENFHIVKEPVNLSEPATTKELIDEVADLKPAFIVLDTLSQCAAGLNENDNGAMAAFMAGMIRLADKTGASVMILHHNSKATGQYRGASAIKANADFHLSLDRPKNDDSNTVFCRCEKQRGKPFEDFTLQGEVVELPDCDEYGDPITSLVFQAIDAPVPTKSQHPNQKRSNETRDKLLELFDQAAQDAEEGGGDVKIGSWKGLVEEEEICSERSFWRYKNAMEKDGTIVKNGTHNGNPLFRRGNK